MIRVLTTRGIDMPAGALRRIRTCTDVALLDLWLNAAITATKVDDLFTAAPEA